MLGKKRKVEKVNDFYEVFKPVDNQPEDSYLINYENDWEGHGRKYTCRGLVDLLEVDRGIEFVLPKEIIEDMMAYRKSCFDRKREYLKNSIQLKEEHSCFVGNKKTFPLKNGNETEMKGGKKR